METEQKKRSFDTFTLNVDKVEDLTPRNKGLRFRLPDGKSLDFKAGQFVQMFIPLDGKIRRTSYSIASPPYHHEFFELCVTLVETGVSSPFLHKLKAGDTIQAMGPLGKFTMPEPLARDPVFIATGSGIAPFRSMILDQLNKKTNRNLYLVFGNRYVNDIIYQLEWEELARQHPNLKVLHTLSRADATWKGKRGYVQDAIEGFVPDVKTKDYYICGLVKMIDAVQEKLIALGVPKEQINFERYD